ncbi:MAG: hypothetical protein ACPGUV_09030 [Polyangiales bacterium]
MSHAAADTEALLQATVLIVEDGDEYLSHLSRYLPGPRYLQAQNGTTALSTLAAHAVDLLYLDMRFDHIPTGALLGDHAATLPAHSGDSARAWRALAEHQGLYILAAIRAAGYRTPAILAHDFQRDPARFARLAAKYAPLCWVPDAVAATEIRAAMAAMLRAAAQGA